MWSIGNEVGEADGSDKSVATVRRLVKTIKDVDATRYAPWELINSALAMAQEAMKK